MTLYCVLVLPLGPHCLCCSLNHSSYVECETFRDSYQMLVPLFAHYAFQIEVCNSIQSLERYIYIHMCVFIYIELIIPSTVLPTLSAFNEILKAQIEEKKKVLI